MGFSSLVRLGHACPLRNIRWTHDLKSDQDAENESRANEGLDHGKMGEALNGVSRWTG